MSLLRRNNASGSSSGGSQNNESKSSRRPFRRRTLYHPPTPSTYIRQSRLEKSGLSRAANHRDRDAILDELLAHEEPDLIPIRKKVTYKPRPARSSPQLVKGWEFLDTIRNGQFPARIPQNIHAIWRQLDAEIDYDNLAPQGLMCIDPEGIIRIQPHKEATRNDWMFSTLHLIYHMALGLLQPPPDYPYPVLWQYACEVIVNRHAASMVFLGAPQGFPGTQRQSRFRPFSRGLAHLPETPEEQIELWHKAATSTLPNNNNISMPDLSQWRTPAGEQAWDVHCHDLDYIQRYRALYLLDQIKQLKPVKSHHNPYAGGVIDRAYHWVDTHFPLLSAVTKEFTLDYESAEQYNITYGAVAAAEQVIFVNPNATLSEFEWRWVLVHEILHVVLEHHKRLNDRDALLWNVACDYVINNWLEMMGVGMRPDGVLFKPDYVGRDAESIYDELLENGGNDQLKVTFRGEGLGDILDFEDGFTQGRPRSQRGRGRFGHGVRQITQKNARKLIDGESDSEGAEWAGDLPGDLIEELDLQKITGEKVEIPPWKADLAAWLDLQLAPRTYARSFSRPSRRQSAAPDIPLAGKAKNSLHSPTFGVVLDTSGSMSHQLLQQGLAAVVAFSEKHGVQQVRMVMCDTRPYDEGFIPLQKLKKQYRIYGRGGTILQPSIDLLQDAHDFPDDAPILIVTDGAIDVLTVEREHAFLLPGDGNLPFEPTGPVFRILGDNPSPLSRFRRRSDDDDQGNDRPPFGRRRRSDDDGQHNHTNPTTNPPKDG